MAREQLARILVLLALLVICAGFSIWIAPFFGEHLYLDSRKLYSTYELYESGIGFPSLGFFGRPIAFASFYLEFCINEGLDPARMRLVNMFLHSINAVLIGLIIHLILSWNSRPFLKKNVNSAFWAVTIAMLWYLLPQSWVPVLYIIQRMVLLASIFSLLTIYAYLQSRMALIENKQKAACIWLLASCIAFMLAVFSKESSVSVIFLVVVIERLYFQFSGIEKLRICYWGLMILLLAVIFLFPFLGYISYDSKPFSMLQRLSMQPLVVAEYVRQTLIPARGEAGIFYDAMNQVETVSIWLRGMAAVSLLAVIALACRCGGVVALLVFGYLSLHMVESTFLPLEMAFLHRNYLAAIFIVVAVVLASSFVVKRTNQRAGWALTFVFVLYAVLVSAANNTLWQQPFFLAKSSYQIHPKSDRALSLLVKSGGIFFDREKQGELLRAHLDNSSQVSFSLLIQYVYYNCAKIKPDEYAMLLQRPINPGVSIEASQAISNLVKISNSGKCGEGFNSFIEQVLDFPVVEENVIWAQQYYRYEYLLKYDRTREAITHMIKLAESGQRKAAVILLLDRSRNSLHQEDLRRLERAIGEVGGEIAWQQLLDEVKNLAE